MHDGHTTMEILCTATGRRLAASADFLLLGSHQDQLPWLVISQSLIILVLILINMLVFVCIVFAYFPPNENVTWSLGGMNVDE